MGKNSNNAFCSEDANDAKEIRCFCNQLLARWAGEGIEFKCKRCKQVVLIPLKDIQPE